MSDATHSPDPEHAPLPHRPHRPREALLLLLVSGLLFFGASLLQGAKGRFLADIAPALAVLAWILPAYVLVSRRRPRRDPFQVHGVLGQPRDLTQAVAVSLLILGLFTVGFVLWKRVWSGEPALRPFPWGEATVHFFWHLVFVALPEEYFFRGVLQPSLDPKHGPPTRLLGARYGRGAILAAALFAVAHVVFDPSHHPARLAVFFPALWFAWLRARTGSILPCVVFHALANALQYGLYETWRL